MRQIGILSPKSSYKKTRAILRLKVTAVGSSTVLRRLSEEVPQGGTSEEEKQTGVCDTSSP